jgi:hypothetical protein
MIEDEPDTADKQHIPYRLACPIEVGSVNSGIRNLPTPPATPHEQIMLRYLGQGVCSTSMKKV